MRLSIDRELKVIASIRVVLSKGGNLYRTLVKIVFGRYVFHMLFLISEINLSASRPLDRIQHKDNAIGIVDQLL